MSDRQCRACGVPLKFVKTAEGKIVPLDLRAPVFMINIKADGSELATRAEKGFHVSHYSTCSKASQFSKKGKT